MKRRIMSLLLCLCMVIPLLPPVSRAAAAEPTPPGTETDAGSADPAGGAPELPAVSTMSDTSGSRVTTDRSDYIWFGEGYNELYFDIRGIDGGSAFRTTYGNEGYRTSFQLTDALNVWGGYQGASLNYETSPTIVDDSVSAGLDLEIVYNGRYVKVTYTVTNTGSTTREFRVGTFADVMIDNNDRAEVSRTENGLRMDGSPRNDYEFQLVAPDCDTLWYGYYSYAPGNVFTDLEDKNTPYDGDSGMAWSWSDTVAPGETWTRYVLIGAGELPEPPDQPTLSFGSDDPTLKAGEQFAITGEAEGSDTVYINFNGQEFEGEVDADGNFSVTIEVPADMPEGETEFTYWGVSDEGGISDVGHQDVTIVHSPFVNLTTDRVTVMEDEEGCDETWLRSFIQSHSGDVTLSQNTIETSEPGTYTVTYTAKLDGYDDEDTATLTVAVLPQPAALTQTEVDNSTGDYTLSAEMTYTGGLTWTETGFVYGVIQNPTLSLCDGKVTTASPVSEKDGELTATVNADELAHGVAYYARAYARTSDGTVIYGDMSETFGPDAPSYGVFSVRNNGNNTFTISRTDGTDGEQTVYYRTVNGSAIGGTHFTHRAEALTFLDGEDTKTITITEYGATAVYGDNAATAYANTDRVYFLEIYRVTGGATIGTNRATRTMRVDGSYSVRKSVYEESLRTVGSESDLNENNVWPTDNNFVADRSGNGDHKIYFVNDRGKNGSHNYENFNVQRSVDVGTDLENEYLKATASGFLYRMTFSYAEDTDGFQHVWISDHAPNNLTAGPTHEGAIALDDGNFGSAIYTARWETRTSGTGSGTLSLPSEVPGGEAREVRSNKVDGKVVDNTYLLFDIDDTAHVWFSSAGSGEDIWYVKSYQDWLTVQDTNEPELLGIAPMAGGVYQPEDTITIALVFDEIVDEANSLAAGLSNCTLDTNYDWLGSSFQYVGGAGTNVLYFTGTVPAGATGTLTVSSPTDCVRDMCDETVTVTQVNCSITIELAGEGDAPTADAGVITNDNGSLSATISSTNAAKLEYAWSEESDQAAVTSWQIAGASNDSAPISDTVTAARTDGTWYLYVRATSDTGLTAYDFSSIDLGTPDNPAVVVPTLTAAVDNSDWAQQRAITLTKSPENATVTVTGPDVTNQAVTDDTYTAAADGVYTFTLSYNDIIVQQMVTVANIDQTGPTVEIADLTNTSHTQAVTLTFSVTDGQSGVDTVSATWDSSSGGSQSATLTRNGDGTYTTTSPDTTGTWTLTVTAADNAGNTGSDTSTAYTVNATRPILTVTQESSSQTGIEYSYSVAVNGNDGIVVTLPDGTTTSETDGTFAITEPGDYLVAVTDAAGHYVSHAIHIDPEENEDLDGVLPDVRLSVETEEWTQGPVTIAVSVYDAGSAGKSVTATYWGADETSKTTIPLTESTSPDEKGLFTGEVTVTQNATYTFTAQDAAGNVCEYTEYRDDNGNLQTEPISVTINNIDTTPPTVESSISPEGWTADPVTVTLTVKDGQSGVKEVKVQKDGSTVEVTGSDGTYTFTADENGDYTVTATDQVGNSKNETVKVETIDTATPTLTVTGGDLSAAELTLSVSASNPGDSGVTVAVSKQGQEGSTEITLDENGSGTYTVTASGTYTFTAATGAGKNGTREITVHAVTVGEDHQLVVDGGKVAVPADPSRDGYTFTGWYDGHNEWNFESDTVEANLTLTAGWTLNPPTTVTIDGAPAGAVEYGGSPVTLTARAEPVAGDGITYVYEWYKDGDPLDGETAATLTLTDVADSGTYTVRVTASDGAGTPTGGSTASAAVTVTIDRKPLTVTWSGLNQTYGSFKASLVVAHLDGVADNDECSVAYTFDPADPADAGTYGVTATLTGADAANYTLRSDSATLTIRRQTVYFTITGNVVQEGTAPAPTVTPSVSGLTAGQDYTISYRQDGQPVAGRPSAAGSYEIWVTFDDDGNYQAAAGLTQQIGTLTITERPPVTYDVTFAAGAEGAAGTAPAPQTAVSGTSLALPANPLTYAGHRFTGWSDGTRLWQPGDLYTVTRDVTFTAQWQAVYAISGTVEQAPEGGGIAAVVTLMYSGRPVAETTASAEGKFSFTGLVPGIYNLVTTYGDQVVTTMVEITNADTHLQITLPAGKTNSVVQVEEVPVTAVGNLEQVFTDEEVYTQDDQTVVTAGGIVEITITASQPKDEQAGDVAALEQAAGSAGVGLTVDLTVTKTVTDAAGQKLDDQSGPVADTGVVLVTRIALPAELRGRDNYTVYRIHGTEEPAAMSRTPDGDGEYFEIDGDTLILHARKYSLYAVSAWDNTSSSGSSYRPAVDDTEHGTVTVSPTRPGRGDTVTITATPDEGYQVDGITVTDRNGNPVDVTDHGDGTYTFVQPSGSVTISATFREADALSGCPRDETCPMYGFPDLDLHAWYHNGVHYCLARGLMVGFDDGTFRPAGTTTRGQIVTILWRLAGSPAADGGTAFSDVPETAWYAEAIDWAVGRGVAEGYGDGSFGPDDPVTREQLAAILCRFTASRGHDVTARADLSTFADAGQVSAWAREAMAWALAEGIVTGVSDTALLPRGDATRAQAAAMLSRFANGMAD